MRTASAQSETTVEGQPIEFADKPEGPIAAAIIAGGVGAMALGFFATLAAASHNVSDWLNFYNPVGPLSGKTLLAVAVWVVSWVVLHLIYRKTELETRRALIIALVLVGLGVIGTFPTFFQAFE